MDYREYARDLLGRKSQLMQARQTLEEEIDMLECEKYSVTHSAVSDTSVAPGGGSRYEEHLINIITVMDNAVFRKRSVDRELRMIERGMQALDGYERDIIETFYIYRVKQPAEIIMKKYFKERSQIFEDKKKALERFTRSIYGIVHL